MDQCSTPEAAWNAYDAGNCELAAQIWQDLLQQPLNLSDQNRYQLNYAHALIALKRHSQAMLILQELYNRTGSPRHLRLLGRIARNAGRLNKAERLLLAEQEHLDASDDLGLAANAYELSLTAWIKDDLIKALGYAETSVSYAVQADDPTSLAMAHRLKADLLVALNRIVEARSQYLLAQRTFSLVNDLTALEELDRVMAELERHPIIQRV